MRREGGFSLRIYGADALEGVIWNDGLRLAGIGANIWRQNEAILGHDERRILTPLRGR